MKPDEVIQIARRLADIEGWPWVGPFLVEEHRRFILFGSRYWRVTTNTKYAAIGRNVHVQIDDETKRVLSSKYVPTLTFRSRATNTPGEVSPPDFSPAQLNPCAMMRSREEENKIMRIEDTIGCLKPARRTENYMARFGFAKCTTHRS